MSRSLALGLLAFVIAGCATADSAASPATSTPPATSTTAHSPEPSASAGTPSRSATASDSPTPTAGEQAVVVEHPADLLAPGSVAKVTVDGLRVRGGPPGTPEHDDVLYTLSAGDEVLVDWTPLAYRSPSQSADGRGWYSVHVGGASVTSWIDGGVNGWVAAGDDGLEYLEHAAVACRSERDLENLIYSPFTSGDQETLATPWERLACNGGRELELTGVLEYVCPEGGVYPYTFEPHLAAPQGCTALMIDAVDADGHFQFGQGLVVRFSEFLPSGLERGDVLRVLGHFDDSLATSCTASTEPGFHGPAVDVPFLVLFCREQFVPVGWEIVDQRALAPLPWAP